MNTTTTYRFLRWLGIILALGFAAFLLYVPWQIGFSLAIPPDAEEYAFSLANLIEHGKFGFQLDGVWYPSRYTPWFSLTCLLPCYLLNGGNSLALQPGILVFSLAVLIILYWMGRKLGLGGWSWIPPILAMLLPDFAFYSRLIMTEIPYTALLLASSLVFLRFVEAFSSPSRKMILAAGLLVTWCGAVRSTGLPMLAPFAIVLCIRNKKWKQRISSIALLATPAILFEILNFTYNLHVFGIPFRNGYNYWCSIPYDYPNMLFNIRYLKEAIPYLMGKPLIQFLLLTLLGWAFISCRRAHDLPNLATENHSGIALFGYFAFQCLVLASLYLPYYWTDVRFFVPISICLLPIPFFLVKSITTKFPPKIQKTSLILIVILLGLFCLGTSNLFQGLASTRPTMTARALKTKEVIPPHSMLILTGDPNLNEYVAIGGRDIRNLPPFRNTDYTMHMVADRSVRNAFPNPPDQWYPMYRKEYVEGGTCKAPFSNVLCESLEPLFESLNEGRRIFLVDQVPSIEAIKPQLIPILESVGLSAAPFGRWVVPAIHPNPIRALYDQLLFPESGAIQQTETTAAFLEIKPNDTIQADMP